MFPKVLYELLPFIYMSTGLAIGVMLDSAIVLIASILLTVTGILVLSMRISYRREIRRRR